MLPRKIIGIEAIDRVEVFKGPSAFVNGVTPAGSGLGGTVNLQPKYASDTPIRRYTQDISSDGRIGEHLDIGQRFGEDCALNSPFYRYFRVTLASGIPASRPSRPWSKTKKQPSLGGQTDGQWLSFAR